MNYIQTPSEKIGLNYREIIILTINLIYNTKNAILQASYAIPHEQCKRIVFSRMYRAFLFPSSTIEILFHEKGVQSAL